MGQLSAMSKANEVECARKQGPANLSRSHIALSKGPMGLLTTQDLGVKRRSFALLCFFLPTLLGSEEPGTLGAAIHQRHGDPVPGHQ